MNRDAIYQADRLIIKIPSDSGIAYDLCRQTLELVTAKYQLKVKVDNDSMTALLAKLPSFARKRKIAPNAMVFNLRRLVYTAVDVMRYRLKHSNHKAVLASRIEEFRSKQRKARDRLEVQLGNRTSTALDTMHN